MSSNIIENDEESDSSLLENDIKLINILVNNKKELRDFLASYNEDMFDPSYRRFLKHLFSYYKTYNSCPSLTTLIEHAAFNVNSNLEEYLIDTWKTIEEQYTDPREFTFILEKLKRRKNYDFLYELKNVLQEKLDEADNNTSFDEINKFISKSINNINSISQKKVYSCADLHDVVDAFVERFKAKQANPELAQGIMTGFSMLDYYTNGLRPSELGVVAADTGGGKSIFLINLAVNVWMGNNVLPSSMKELNSTIQNNSWLPGNDVLFISIEMPVEEIEERILSCMCTIDSLNLSKGKLQGAEEPGRLAMGLRFWKNYPGRMRIIDVPRGCSMSQIQSIFDDTCLTFRPKLVIIDYLGLLTDNDGESDADWEKLKNVAEQMHEFARMNEVSVFTGLQVKVAKPGEGGIGLHRIGRSSMIMHNVNIGLQIENRENENMRPDSQIHCIKFRRGPLFVMNNLRKEFMYTRFADSGMPALENQETGRVGEDLSGLLDAIGIDI